jgi:signal peptidase I
LEHPSGRAIEKPSPYNWVSEDKIHVYDDKVIIDLKGAEWAAFTDTNSMDPILDHEANAIEIIPKRKKDIHVGDIISYKLDFLNYTIIHRVIKISYDKEGWYAITKGDNLDKPDPFKIRFNDIKRVLVAIIY